MHALTRFIRSELDARSWKQVDLVRRSGLKAQVVSYLVNDKRDALVQRPDDETVDRLAQAFSCDREVVLAKVGEAMGIPVSGIVEVSGLQRASNAELLAEVSRRLDGGASANLRAGEPVGPDVYDFDVAAHTDDAGYVRTHDREAPPDEGA